MHSAICVLFNLITCGLSCEKKRRDLIDGLDENGKRIFNPWMYLHGTVAVIFSLAKVTNDDLHATRTGSSCYRGWVTHTCRSIPRPAYLFLLCGKENFGEKMSPLLCRLETKDMAASLPSQAE
jgi:hypothetical protein